MRKRGMRYTLIVVSLLTMSCAVVGVSLTATPDESAMHTRVAQGVAATVAALPTATQPVPTATPVPTSSTPPPPPPPSAPVPPAPNYVLQEEQSIAGYAIRRWHDPTMGDSSFLDILTISAAGQAEVQIESFFELGVETGADVTGEGHPDLVVRTYTGGAHCCSSTIVYDLGPTLTRVLETPLSNCLGSFEDLDGDGVLEFRTCDDLFAYRYCCYVGSPMVRAVLAYEPSAGYVPVSPLFAGVYADDIAAHTQMAEEAAPGAMCEWDQTTKCGVLPLVLDYLYSGHSNQAWAEFDRLYDYPDKNLWWAEIVQAVSASPLYALAGPLPEAHLPPYYMLQLLTNCGPEWQYVGFLREGQPACDLAVPQRDIYWLETELYSIGLLATGERLELGPEGCTTTCRLDVVSLADNARVGSIRLDTTIGFPGAVYRVNGVESARWRLRGDLAWEQVSP